MKDFSHQILKCDIKALHTQKQRSYIKKAKDQFGLCSRWKKRKKF